MNGKRVVVIQGQIGLTPITVFEDDSSVNAHHRMIVKKGATINNPTLTIDLMSKHKEVKAGDAVLMHYVVNPLREVVEVFTSRVQDGYLYATVAVK